MTNVQVQSPSSTVASTSQNTSASALTNVTSNETKSSSFVETLTKVIKGQEGEQVKSSEQAEASSDVAISMLAAIMPSFTSHSMNDDIKATVQALIQVIQTMDPEQVKSLMEQPELQQWMAKVEQQVNSEYDNMLTALKFQDALAAATKSGSQQQSDPIPLIVDELKRYIDLLDTKQSSLALQQLGSELQKIITKASEVIPALTAASTNAGIVTSTLASDVMQSTSKLAEANSTFVAAAVQAVDTTKTEGAKTDKLTNLSFGSMQLSQSSTSNSSSGDTLNQQQPQSHLLQRLAYLNPHVMNTSDQTVSGDASAATIDSATSQLDDVPLTLTQLSDSAKLASLNAEAKAAPTVVSAQAFAEEMSRVLVKNMSITQLNGNSEAKISLLPEHLGQVNVKISIINGQVTANFMAESAHARDLIELQLPQLRASLQQLGLQVDKLNVEQQYDLGSNLFQDQRHQQSSQQSTQHGSKNAKDYDQLGNDYSFEMDQATRVNRLTFGGTFNATA